MAQTGTTPPADPVLVPAPPLIPVDAYAVLAPEADDGLLRGAIPLGPDRLGLKGTDVPPGVLAEKRAVDVSAMVNVGADGTVTACEETEVPLPALRGILCRAVTARARFLPALDRNGGHVADRVPIRGVFLGANIPSVPAPPAPQDGDNRDPLIRAHAQTLELLAEPDWARFHPGVAGEAAVQITAFRIQPDGSASYYCTPLRPAQDQPSWKAACAAMKTARYRTRPELGSNELTMLVRWLGNGAATLELAPAGKMGKPLRWADPARQRVPEIVIAPDARPQASMTFAVGGRTPQCRIIATTGSDTGDQTACHHLESLPFESPVDVFGRSFKVEQRVPIRALSSTAAPAIS